MGGIFSRVFGKIPNSRILLLGLDGAGKTTLLYKLKLGDLVQTVPTIGFNVEEVKYNNLSMTVWDIGGQDKVRSLWHHYYDNCNGLIFLIDSADRERIDEAIMELKLITDNDRLPKPIPVLILANKQDIPNSIDCKHIIQKLNNSLRGLPWFIQGCSVTKEIGYEQGLDWLATEIKKIK